MAWGMYYDETQPVRKQRVWTEAHLLSKGMDRKTNAPLQSLHELRNTDPNSSWKKPTSPADQPFLESFVGKTIPK